MKQIILAFLLIVAPAATFFAIQHQLASADAQVASLGDLGEFKKIISDVQTIVKTGDLTAAEKRITDFETAWDDAEPKLRPVNEYSWGVIDTSADGALHALRAQTPDTDNVEATLSALLVALDNPSTVADVGGSVVFVSGIAVSDEHGHPLPCEAMLAVLNKAIAENRIAKNDNKTAFDFAGKATERCNADDDLHADSFSAQGLALVSP